MISPHPADDLLESYAMGRLAEHDLVPVEEHLLICAHCQEAVQEIETFVKSTRAAARIVEQHNRPGGGWRVFRKPLPYAVAGCAAVLALAFIVPLRRTTPETIQLVSLRGSDSAAPRVHSGVPLNLDLDIQEIAVASSYTVELVDVSGTVRWEQAKIEPATGRLKVLVATRLSPGQYWVRVYGNSFKSELLREYSLQVV